MISKLRMLIFQIRMRLAGEFDRAGLVARHLKVRFGRNVRLTGIPNFGSEPYLITIGSNVTITQGVTFHTHDGGVGLLRSKYPGIDIIKPIKIGDNVFIGSNVTILPGVVVGNNVIIGASSLIAKDIPDNVVVAGVPARVIKTFQEYEQKSLESAIYIVSRNNPRLRMEEIKKALNYK